MNRTETFFRLLFYFVFLSGGAIVWLANHPPMVDLPQHAGQVVLLHDLLLHRSPWQGVVRINYFTPYWIGYGVATLLSFVMPVVIALKLQLTLAYYGFVLALIFVRRRLGGDARLDWLFLIGWFGYAYEYGFFTFLVSAPFAVLYIEWTRTYATSPTWRRGCILFASGVVLFFCHGLIFLFANVIGGTYLIVRCRHNLLTAGRVFWPYTLLGALCITYFLAHREVDVKPMYPFAVLWQTGWIRLLGLCMWPWGITQRPVVALGFTYLLCLGVGMLQPRTNQLFGAMVPFVTVLLILLLVPEFAANTFFLYQRFGLFAFPFLALMIVRRQSDEGTSPHYAIFAHIGQAMLALVCVGFFIIQARDAAKFDRESRDFGIVTQALAPGQRVLSLVWDRASPAANNTVMYENFAAWYQAEKGGLVDFNFAWFPPQIVRYRLDHLPTVGPSEFTAFEEKKWFEPDYFEIWKYKYLIVRNASLLSGNALKSDHCTITLLKSVGTWSAYTVADCR